MNRFSDSIAAAATRTVRSVCIGLVLIPTASCHGASPDWNGTWKLDPARGDIPGPSIVVSISPDGMWHDKGVGGPTANFRCDGKEYQATDILAIYCTQVDSSHVELTGFKNGSKLFVAHWELSPDGKVLSVKSTSFHTDGTVQEREKRYTRTSGSVGFAGGWRNVNPLEEAPSIQKITLQGHTLHRYLPANDRHLDVPLDGTEAALGGTARWNIRARRTRSARVQFEDEAARPSRQRRILANQRRRALANRIVLGTKQPGQKSSARVRETIAVRQLSLGKRCNP